MSTALLANAIAERLYENQKELSWHRDDFEKRFVLADDDDLGEAPNYKLFPKHVTNVLDHPLDVGQQYWQPNGISFFGLRWLAAARK